MLTAGSLEALADYFGKQPHVDAAFLFGSQARGHVRAGSDVDIGVLMMRAAPREPLRAVRFTNDLMDLLGRSDVDVAILNDASPSWFTELHKKAVFSMPPATRSWPSSVYERCKPSRPAPSSQLRTRGLIERVGA